MAKRKVQKKSKPKSSRKVARAKPGAVKAVRELFETIPLDDLQDRGKAIAAVKDAGLSGKMHISALYKVRRDVLGKRTGSKVAVTKKKKQQPSNGLPKTGTRAKFNPDTKIGRLREFYRKMSDEELLDKTEAAAKAKDTGLGGARHNTSYYAARKEVLQERGLMEETNHRMESGDVLKDLLQVKRWANQVGGVRRLRDICETLEKLST